MQYFLGMAWAVLGAGRISSEECVNVSGGRSLLFCVSHSALFRYRLAMNEKVLFMQAVGIRHEPISDYFPRKLLLHPRPPPLSHTFELRL